MGGGLLADGTWAVHSTLLAASGAPITGIQGDSNINIFPTRLLGLGGFGMVNLFDPLEGNVLYFLCETFSNNDSIGFEVELRRNGASTVAKISFAPNEVARKALILNVPFLPQEFMQWRIIKPQTGSLIFYNLFLAGKL